MTTQQFSSSLARPAEPAEVALKADHLLVSSRGQSTAEMTTAEPETHWLLSFVSVRSPQAHRLARLLAEHGAKVVTQSDGALAISGMPQIQIGDLAGDAGIPLHELATRAVAPEVTFR